VPTLGGEGCTHGQHTVDNQAYTEKEKIKSGAFVLPRFAGRNWFFFGEAAHGDFEFLWVRCQAGRASGFVVAAIPPRSPG
jgi:hypothetical protein